MQTISLGKKVRFMFLALSGFVFSIFLWLEAFSAIQSGVLILKLRRTGLSQILTQTGESFGFTTGVILLSLAGLLSFSIACWGLRTLLSSSKLQSREAIENHLTLLERDAPSGLTPLWVGLLIVGAVFIFFVVS
jgi:hypothetical protein